jgi:peroxiredoxin
MSMRKSLTIATAVLLIAFVVWWAMPPRDSVPPGPGIPDNSIDQPGATRTPDIAKTEEDEDPEQLPMEEGQHHGVYPGDRAYVFQLSDLEGNTVKLSDYRDEVVLLCFWQTTCSWCLEELPLLDRLYTAYKDGDVTVLAINVAEERDSVRETIADNGYTFPVLFDDEADIAKKYMISYLPTNFIINRRGEISAVHIGLMEYEGMEDYIEAAFRE